MNSKFIEKETLRILLEDEKLPIIGVAKKLGKCPQCVKKWMDEYNLNTHPKNWKKEKRSRYIQKLIPKEWLQLEYVDKNRTANDIATELSESEGYTIYAGAIINLCKLYDIKTKNSSDSGKQSMPKKKESLVKNLGVDHPSKCEKIKQRKIDKSIAKYGTENVFQSEEIKEKSKQTLFRKYGVYNPVQMDTYTRNNGRRSKIQKRVEKFLEINQVQFDTEVQNKFSKFNELKNGYYCPIPDIVVNNLKVVIEVYGDYYHANPITYKPTDTFKLWDGEMTAEEIWARDRNRKEHIESFGYRVLEIWERDIINKTFEETLLNEIHKN